MSTSKSRSKRKQEQEQEQEQVQEQEQEQEQEHYQGCPTSVLGAQCVRVHRPPHWSIVKPVDSLPHHLAYSHRPGRATSQEDTWVGTQVVHLVELSCLDTVTERSKEEIIVLSASSSIESPDKEGGEGSWET